jgi:hypothetical protein
MAGASALADKFSGPPLATLSPAGEVLAAVGTAEDQFVNPYTLTTAQKSQSFRRIIPEQLALPPSGHEPIDAAKFLRWPYDELFSAEVLKSCLLTPEELEAAGPRPRCRVSMAPGRKYSEVVLAFLDCGMVSITREEAKDDEYPVNGLFAVAKSETSQRPIIDATASNFVFSQRRFQAAYERIIGRQPDRAAQLRLTSFLMNVPSPSTLGRLPHGAFGHMATDKKSYFYCMLQLLFMVRYQRLPRIWGEEIGYGPGWFSVWVIVMAMGSWISATLAHLIHLQILRDMERPVLFRLPAFQAAPRVELFQRLLARADAQGRVASELVPRRFWGELASVGHSAGGLFPVGVTIPANAFRLEPVQPADRRGDHASFLELSTVFVVQGPEGRQALAHGRHRARRSGIRQVLALSAIYLDDNNSFCYRVCPADEQAGPGAPRALSAPDDDDWAASQLQCLMAIMTSLAHGFLESWSKLRWPSAAPGKALGVHFEFLAERGRLRWEVHPSRRFVSADLRWTIATTQALFVSFELFDHAIGNWVWEVLPCRPFLSVARVCYAARHSESARARGTVHLSPAVRRELRLSCYLAPAYYSETNQLDDLLVVYDASGKTDEHNGGYGVACRHGLSELAASEFDWHTRSSQFGKLPAYKEPAPGEIPLDRGKTILSKIACTQASRLLRHDWEASTGPWWMTYRGVYRVAPAFIAIGEMCAAVLALQTAVHQRRRSLVAGKVFVIGGDNSVACSCLRKGRSGTKALNDGCRRAAVVGFCFDCSFIHFWLPSKSNPGDGPSRVHEDPRPRTRLGRLKHAWVRDLTEDGDVEPRPGPPPANGPYAEDFPARRRKQRAVRHRFCGRHYHVEPKAVRIARGGRHALAFMSLNDTSLRRYLRAFDGVMTYVYERGHLETSLGASLGAFVSDAFTQGFMSRSEAQTAITSVRYLCPGTKERGDLQIANRYLAAWRKLAPGRSHIPIPRHIAEMLAAELVASGIPGAFDAGVALLLTFDSYLRHSEVRNLRNRDVLLPGDPGNFDHLGTLYVRRTKAGKPQAVVLDKVDVFGLLAAFENYKVAEGRDGRPRASYFVFGTLGRKKMTLLLWMQWAQRQCGYRNPLFVVHSCRHGGATHDFVSRLREVGEIKVRGRWKSYTALEIYLQVGQSLLAAASVPAAVRVYFGEDLGRAKRELAILLAPFAPPPR